MSAEPSEPVDYYELLQCDSLDWVTDSGHADPNEEARRLWREGVQARQRQRQVLYALGYELLDKSFEGNGLEAGHVLPTYVEVWVGDLGTITVQWNHDPTAP